MPFYCLGFETETNTHLPYLKPSSTHIPLCSHSHTRPCALKGPFHLFQPLFCQRPAEKKPLQNQNSSCRYIRLPYFPKSATNQTGQHTAIPSDNNALQHH